MASIFAKYLNRGKHFLIMIVIRLASLLSTSCNDKLILSNKLIDKFVADSKANEWENPLNYYDSKSKLQYSIANDDDNLYICLKASDEETQIKVLVGGMTIYFYPNDRKNGMSSINFPLPISKEMPSFTNPKVKPSILSIKNMYAKSLKEFEVKGFNLSSQSQLYQLNGNIGFNLSLDWDPNDILVYEISIPLKKLLENTQNVNDSLSFIGLTMKLKGLEMPPQLNGSPSSEMVAPQQARMPQRPSSNVGRIFQDEIIKVKVKLDLNRN